MTNQASTVATPILEPIRKAFPAEKAQSWLYKIHPYYTRQPANLVGEYIRHFCPPGGLVADPFCGSGVTLAEALTNRRRAFGLDLDPLAVFITRQTCLAPVDLEAFQQAYRQVEGELAPIMDFVRRAAPKELEGYELKEWVPKGVKLPSNADRGYVEDLFGRAQLIALAHLRAAILKVKDATARELLLFTFSGILARASITYGIDPKQAGGGDSSIFRVYRYWVPPHPDYRDVWELFRIRFRLVARAKKRSNEAFGDFVREGETFAVHHDSAENLGKYTSEKSVDYIYTDPPYGAHISYLDLSTMWHAWLGLAVTPAMRGQEAIEGGEQQFDSNHYLAVLQKSFEAMFQALKEDAWLSLVFHHKETRLWYALQDMLRYIGFKYANTVAQPLSRQSFHKTKNPLRVLGESLIVNFQKSPSRKFFEPVPLPLANVVKNAAERAIVQGGGATTEEILRAVVPELFEANLILDAASKNMGDILAILEDDFELDKDNLWHLKKGRTVGAFIPPKERIQYYLVTFLRREGKATFDAIVTTLMPLLINGHKPTKEEISDVLNDVAISYDGVHWELKDPNQQGKQVKLLSEKTGDYVIQIPSDTVHNQHIYRLALLGLKAGLVPFIGKQERVDPILSPLHRLQDLNIKVDEARRKRIEQIDIVWATQTGLPVWAFEIEESTPITSALERFTAIIEAAPELGRARRLTIVAPKGRRRKLNQELSSSSFIGRPQYMENKVSYIFAEDLEVMFNKFATLSAFKMEQLHQVCQSPALTK